MAKAQHKLQRVTHVDDDVGMRVITEFACTAIGGLELDSCASGAEALVRTPDFDPDVIILDVMMPGMDGIETYTKLRAIDRLADTPIAFMTAKVGHGYTEKYMELGAAAVIAKPFDPLSLADTIFDIWSRRNAA